MGIRYLNKFLVFNSQKFLDWLCDQNSVDVSVADSIWMQLVPSADERKAIFQALSQHYLIFLDGSLIRITPKGKEYVELMGRVPDLQSLMKAEASKTEAKANTEGDGNSEKSADGKE